MLMVCNVARSRRRRVIEGGPAHFSTFLRGQRRQKGVKTLILLRHGQSEWNSPTPTFTGWADISLTDAGRREAFEAGQLLARRRYEAVDVVFTSELKRAYETAEIVVNAISEDFVQYRKPLVVRDWRFNERHYGAIQGICKNDASLHSVYGKEKVLQWRRSMHASPPPLDEQHPHYLPPPAPLTESLSDCKTRCLEGYKETLERTLFSECDTTMTALFVAHANTLRALISHFDGVADADVPKLHVPNSVPIIYRFCPDTRLPISTKLESPAGGSHARWLLSTENCAKIHKALDKGGMLTRALFEAWDRDGNRSLTAQEIDDGLKSLSNTDVAVSAIARRIARELTLNYCIVEDKEICSLEEFEKTAAKVTAKVMSELAETALSYSEDQRTD